MDNSNTPTSAKSPTNNGRWEHKELLAVIADPTVTRVKERDGLYGIVKRSKDGTPSVLFRWRFRHSQVLCDFTAGSFPRDGLKAIRESHRAAIELHKSGENPNITLKLKKKNAAIDQFEQVRLHTEETVEALALKWQEADLVKRGRRGRKDNGVEAIRSFQKDVFPSIGSFPINAVPKKAWVDLLDSVKARAPSMAGNLFADLKQFLEWCERRDYLESSPLRKIQKSDIEAPYQERQRTLWNPQSNDPPAELLELVKKLPEAKLQRKIELAIFLMLSTLCRVGELSLSTWKRVDFEKREWHLPAEDTKNAAEHRVYISDFTLRSLRELHSITGNTAWCFPNREEKSHSDVKNITKILTGRQTTKKLKNRSKETSALLLSGGEWTSHDLRRTGAHIMNNIGVDPLTIESCLNHIKDKLMRTYQGPTPWASKKDAWEKLGKYLESILPQPPFPVPEISE